MILKKLVLVGASSTGKTTTYKLLKEKLPKYEFISESTRTVASYGFPINEEGTDITQLAISSFHLNSLLTPYNTVYDRCYLDLVAYSRYVNTSKEVYKFITDIWEEVQHEYTHYIYFPIEFISVEDGVRSVDEKWRTLIDEEIARLLRAMDKPFLTVSGSPSQRIDQILKFIKDE